MAKPPVHQELATFGLYVLAQCKQSAAYEISPPSKGYNAIFPFTYRFHQEYNGTWKTPFPGAI